MAVTLEVLFIIHICSANKVYDIILSFITFAIIADIDYLFAVAINYRFFMRVLRESEIVIEPT